MTKVTRSSYLHAILKAIHAGAAWVGRVWERASMHCLRQWLYHYKFASYTPAHYVHPLQHS